MYTFTPFLPFVKAFSNKNLVEKRPDFVILAFTPYPPPPPPLTVFKQS